MKLKKGIRIYNRLESGFDAIYMNSGVVHHSNQKADRVNFNGLSYIPLYDKNAYVVKRNWKPISANDIRILDAKEKNTDRKYYNTVILDKIPKSIQDKFESLDIKNCSSRDEVMSIFKSSPKKIKDISESLSSFISKFSNEKPFNFQSITTNYPNLEMVACNITKLPKNFTQEQRKYEGMHNDGTQFMTPYTAYKHNNRLCINLSSETRFFFLINLTLPQVMYMLKKKMDTKNITVYTVAKSFFEMYPDYPIIKIEQRPYEFYIAPTDNCFHDGSTLGNKYLDINMVYFGFFQC